MPDGRGARIALEAGFLVGVAAVLGLAEVRPLWIVLVMLLAWVIVALLEWVAWRDEPHWASGSPPRYYVPQQPLPPRPPSEELPAFGAYPRAPAEPRATEAPTWIATPEMREELLGWPAPRPEAESEPVAVDEPEPVAVEPAPASVPVDEPEPETEPVAQPQPEPVPVPVLLEPAAPEPGPAREELPQELLHAASVAVEPEPEEPPAGWPIEDGDTAADPWTVAELDGGRDDSSQGADGDAPAGSRLARHRIDPFEDADRRRWPWQRRVGAQSSVAELPPLPRHVRLEPEDEK